MREHRENVHRDSHCEHSPIVDLGMSDIEYLQALNEGRDPRQEQVYERSLIAEGVEVADAKAVAPLIDKYPRLPEEQAIVTNVWSQLIATPNVTENSVLPLDTDEEALEFLNFGDLEKNSTSPRHSVQAPALVPEVSQAPPIPRAPKPLIDGGGFRDREEVTINANSGRTDSMKPGKQQAVSHAVNPEFSAAQVAQKMLSKLPSCQTRQFLTALTRELQHFSGN